MLPVVNLGVNRRGGLYVNGKRLPSLFWEKILDLHHVNLSQQQISELTRTRAVHLRTKITPDVMEFIDRNGKIAKT